MSTAATSSVRSDVGPPAVERAAIEAVSCQGLATRSVAPPPANAGASWWIQRVFSIPQEKRSGWVVAQIIDEFASECKLAELLQKETFAIRMRNAGLNSLADVNQTPRKRCVAIGAAGQDVAALLDESGQRSMLDAIKFSLKSYASGVRCWAAFADAMRFETHFPATETFVVRYCAVFGRAGTLGTYMQHLRWAHRFLWRSNAWHTDVVSQVIRGIRKSPTPPRLRLALQAQDVRKLVKRAVARGDVEMAALLSVGRAFLFRMPSECIPLQLAGEHSEVVIEGEVLKITLARRKCSSVPSLLERHCCCARSGRSLCAVHQMAPILELARQSGSDRLFSLTAPVFQRRMRELAAACEIPHHDKLGTHALRRGMARDIIDAGGSLAVLLRAGDWKSASYIKYLWESQFEERAAADLLIDHSDSE